VQATVIGTVAGPHITRYELRLRPNQGRQGRRSSRTTSPTALAATDIRILGRSRQAGGRGRVPNAHRRIVRLRRRLPGAAGDWSPLTVWLGKDVAGKAIGADWRRCPTCSWRHDGRRQVGCGQRDPVGILLRATPHQVRLVLVDPSRVELNHLRVHTAPLDPG